MSRDNEGITLMILILVTICSLFITSILGGLIYTKGFNPVKHIDNQEVVEGQK